MTVNVTNPAINRTRLSERDNADYTRSGSHAKAMKALARTSAYRGNQKYQRNRPMKTEDGSSGNSFFGGRQIQQLRQRKIGEERRRAESFIPTIVRQPEAN